MPITRISASFLCVFLLLAYVGVVFSQPLVVPFLSVNAAVPPALSSASWPAPCRLRIEVERQYLLSKKPYLVSRLQQSAPVIRYIGQELKKMRLPAWLVWLPLLESSYRSQAVSSAGAAGVWQLMPDTATRFGLAVSAGQDDRLELDRSTQAALRYLQWLADYFSGDWALALAGYNAGEMRIKQAQEKAQQTAYCDLALPSETQRYVPRLLALIDIIQHAKQYGLNVTEHEVQKPRLSVIDTGALPPLLLLDRSVDPFIIPKASAVDFQRRDMGMGKQPTLISLSAVEGAVKSRR
jgi:hypothetical protein